MEEVRSSNAIRGCKDDVQPHIERLPGMAHQKRIAIQAVQLLDALEAVVDEECLENQGVAGVHALLDAASHVVVPEGQAVVAPVCLDHAVLSVPDLRPAVRRVNRAVGHAAIQIIGEVQLHVALGGGGVLVEAVRRVGPRDARLGGGCTVADGVVGVGVRIGGVHIGLCPRQFRAVIVGVGDGVGIGVCAPGAGHGGAPPDGIIDIAVCGDCAVLDLRDEVTVCLVAPCGGDSVGAGRLEYGHKNPVECRDRRR